LVPSFIALTLGNVQHLVTLVVVGPAVIQAVADIGAGRAPSFRRSYSFALARFWTLLGATLRALVTILVLLVTIVGIPWAAMWAVRWAFFGQAAILDGAGTSEALARSARAVRGRWWWTLGVGAVLFVAGAALGPLVAIPLMIGVRAPLELVNGVSGVIYAFIHPFAVVAATVLYRRLADRSASIEAGSTGSNPIVRVPTASRSD
jgi:hypothetical protein